MIDLSRLNRVLTAFAHPDDETLAAGASLAKISRLGAEIHVMIPATGIYARRKNEAVMATELEALREDCLKAMSCLGIADSHVIFGEFPDNEMDSGSLLTVIHWMHGVFDRIKPDLVLTHHRECTNIDHRVCFEAVTVLTRPGIDFNIPVLCGEVPSSTGYRRPVMFEPNLYVEVSGDDVDRKIRAMQSYSGEARPEPHPRSPEVLRALAKVRGSEAGFHWAEAFMMIRGFG